jgi:hypothetical protein
MDKSTATGQFRAIKCHIRTLLTGLFLFFGLFIFSNSVLATSPSFFYDFESPDYTVGNINGQNCWAGSGSSTVSTEAKYTNDQGVLLDNTIIDGNSTFYRSNLCDFDLQDPIIAGEISLWWKMIKGSEDYPVFHFEITTNEGNKNDIEFLYINSTGHIRVNGMWANYCNLHNNTWYNLKLKWDLNISTSTYFFDCGDGSGFIQQDLQNDMSEDDPGITKMTFYQMSGPRIGGGTWGHAKSYIDAISTPIYPPASSDLTALVLPAYPPTNSTTTLSGGQVGFNGLYSYNTSTDFTIYGLKAVLTDIADPSIQFTFDKDISENTSGSYTILGSLPDGTFLISWLFGYYDNAGFKFYYPAQDPAYVIMENSTYSATGTEAIYPTIPQDDCSLVSGVENWLCNIKNFFSNIFYISPAKMEELNSSLDKMKDKFPYNYIAIDQDFFTDLKNGINPTSTISLTIMGNSQIINFGVLQNSTGTVAGTTQNTSNVLKNLFSIIILLGFLIYAINFGRRIFK